MPASVNGIVHPVDNDWVNLTGAGAGSGDLGALAATAGLAAADARALAEEALSRSGTSVAGIVATYADLPLTPRDGQAFIVTDETAMYVRSDVLDEWVGPVPVQGAATEAAIADAVTKPAVKNALAPGVTAVIRDRTRTWNAAAHGVPTDGATLAHTALATLLGQMAPGDILFIPPGATVRLGASVPVANPIVLDAPGMVTTSANINAFDLTYGASGSRIRQLNGAGPGGPGVSRLIRATGSAASPVQDLKIENVTASGFYGNLLVELGKGITTRDVTTKNGHYHGQMFLSCSSVKVYNPVTHGLTGLSGNGNSYPVMFSRDSSKPLSTHPRPAHCRVYGGETRDTTWEAIDTHGGIDIKVYDHHSVNTRFGVAFVPCVNQGGVPTWAPIDCWAFNCAAESGVSDGTAESNFLLAGTATAERASGGFVACTGAGGGNQSTTFSGAALIQYSDSAMVHGMTLHEPSPSGLVAYTRNHALTVNGLHVIDPWSNITPSVQGVNLASDHNSVSLNNVRVSRGTKSATHVANQGIRASTGRTGVEITLGQSLDLAATSVPLSGTTLYLRGGFFGSTGVAKPSLTYSRSGETIAQAQQRAALSALGLVTDSTVS